MRNLILFVLVFCGLSAFGQNIKDTTETVIIPEIKINDPDIREVVMTALGSGFRSDSLRKSPTNHSYLFCIALSFDSLGLVNKVYFSKMMNERLKRIINVNADTKIETRIDSRISKKDAYKNRVVLFPVLIQRNEDTEIKNLNDFLKDYRNLWPELQKEDQAKKIILLDPYINIFTYSIN